MLGHKGTIFFSIKVIDNLIRRTMDRELRSAEDKDLTLLHAWILGFLYKSEQAKQEVYQKDIEQEFIMNRASASGVLALMERKGLIVRSSVSHDARLKKLALTEKGAALHQKNLHRFFALEQDVESCLTEEEIRNFFAITKKIQLRLEESLAKEGKGGY